MILFDDKLGKEAGGHTVFVVQHRGHVGEVVVCAHVLESTGCFDQKQHSTKNSTGCCAVGDGREGCMVGAVGANVIALLFLVRRAVVRCRKMMAE